MVSAIWHLWRTLDDYVVQARAEEDFSEVRAIGLDATAARRGHNYISLFHDLDDARMLFTCEGRKGQVVKQFADNLEAHGAAPRTSPKPASIFPPAIRPD